MYYNMTNMTNIDGSMVAFLQNIGYITGGIFWNMILLTIFIISYTALSGYPLDRSLLPSLYLTTISGFFFTWMNLVPDYVGYSLILLTAVATLYIYWKKSEEGA